MASDLYCSRGDVNERLPGGSISYEGRLVSSALASTDTFVLDGHGFENDTPVSVRAVADGSLPSPLDESTTYYVKRTSNTKFQLAASAGGAAINLTTDAVSMVVAREPAYDNVIEFVSRWADSCLPGDAVPLTAPIHPLIRGVVADIAAKRLMAADGKSSGLVDAAEVAGKAILDRYVAGLALRKAAGVTTTKTNLAVVVPLADSDGRGWGTGALP